MLANIEFDYNTRRALTECGRELYKEFQTRFSELKLDDWAEDQAECPYIYNRSTVIDLATDNGWRILAVCPPNSQRRPDYILGKTS